MISLCSSSHHRWVFPCSLAAFLVLTAIVMLLLSNSTKPAAVVDKHPNTFSVDFGDDRVALRVATGARYGLGEDANDEWDRILPRRGHVVRLSESPSMPPEPYTITLFHQLKCLQIIRSQYLTDASEPISSRTRHCMNYLRQTLYCHLNMGIESVEDAEGRASRDYDAVCKDWTRVYAEADRNQEAFANRG